MDAAQVTAMITALANGIAAGRSVGELTYLGAMLTQLADTINTIAARRILEEECEESCKTTTFG